MWYPNRNQWRVIWAVAAIFTLLAATGLPYGNFEPFLFMFLIDAVLLVWKLQRGSN